MPVICVREPHLWCSHWPTGPFHPVSLRRRTQPHHCNDPTLRKPPLGNTGSWCKQPRPHSYQLRGCFSPKVVLRVEKCLSAHPWIKSAHWCRQLRARRGTALLSSSHSPSNPSRVGLERPTELLLQSVYRANENPVIKEENVLVSLQSLCIAGPLLCGMSTVLEENCSFRNTRVPRPISFYPRKLARVL